MLTAPEIQLVKLARLLRKKMILVMKMFSLRSLRVKNFFPSTNLNCTQDVGKTLTDKGKDLFGDMGLS